MKTIATLLLGAFLLSSFEISADNISDLASNQGCFSNCSIVLDHEGQRTTIAKNATGDMIYVARLRVPPTAKLQSTTSSEEVIIDHHNQSAQTADDDGGYTKTTTQTYSGPSGYWVVVTIISYDADGNIIDVNSSTSYFPKNQER